MLLACHIVARQELPLPPEPNEEAERQEREYIAKELAAARILDAKVACRDQEIWSLKHELAAARRELECASSQAPLGNSGSEAPLPGGAGEAELQERAVPSGAWDRGDEEAKKPARRLILESHDPACVPLKESELWKLEKSGVAWLAELGELIATLIPINEYDTAFRNNLIALWRNADRNYRLQGIIPERQNFPSLESIRKGAPFSMSIPTDRGKYSRA